MRTILLASLAALSALLTSSGCTAFGCGDFDGGGNRALERGSEMLLLCDNGGFVASLETSMLEGRYSVADGTMTVGTKGDDGSLAFELVDNFDGTFATRQLGDGAWTYIPLDKVAADHANVLCEDLEVRDWWVAP
jgi:hypothetical protein